MVPHRFFMSISHFYYTYSAQTKTLTKTAVDPKKRDVPFVKLPGEWIGNYPGHFDQVISISEKDGVAEAIKVTGDDFVPAGEITWRAHIRTGIGEGQIAEHGFRNPQYIAGHLEILDEDKICFKWEGLGSVEYRRDD
jgi:hypothetical protein